MIRLLLILCLLLPEAAQADTAQQLFDKGDYAAAADAARAQRTAGGDALAARAMLVRAAYLTADRAQAEKLIDTALADARRGQQKDASAMDPLLQEGVALGYRAKLRRSPKIARAARTLFDRVFARDPKNPYAALSLGAWNGEPIADLGGFLARTLLGATRESAIRHYELALSLDGQNPVLPVFYGFNLYRMDAATYGPRTEVLLARALTLPTHDAYEARVQQSAREVLLLLRAGDMAAATRAIRLHQPFGQILVKK